MKDKTGNKGVPMPVGDLGVAAYMAMKGCSLSGRRDKTIYFFVPAEKLKEFKRWKLDYLVSEFHRFDHCLMSLKKVDESDPDEDFSSCKFLTDLGAAAYVLMQHFRIVGRRGKAFYFEINDEEEAANFDQLRLEYVTSEFHEFDSALMSVKKIGES
jgi:hypothetical protein